MRFFDTNPSGRILNRFSKDMGAADEFLPVSELDSFFQSMCIQKSTKIVFLSQKAILDATQIILNMFGAIIVTAIVNPLFLVPVAVLGFIFIYVRKVYLKTGKNIKRLEGISELNFCSVSWTPDQY